MSVSRKNWAALSSLARQWTMEDEEEVERERRRRVRSSCSAADPDDDLSPGHSPRDIDDCVAVQVSTSYSAPAQSGAEQIQLDFLKKLQVRDEKRRKRHVETLRQQKEEEKEESGQEDEEGGESREVRLEILGDQDEEMEEETAWKVEHPPQTQPQSPTNPMHTPATMTTSIIDPQHENYFLSENKDSNTKPPPVGSRKFVSSMSISFDKSLSPTEESGTTTPMSPCSPTAPLSPRVLQPPPEHSPSPIGAQSLTHKGHTQDKGISRPVFIRQTSRTASYRMLRKHEEDSMPLKRSASVRTTSKAFEANADQKQEEVKTSPFQRNSRQRVSSRSIQEKMERLAQASQKSEMLRSPDVTQRTLFLLDEVSRKRGLFEKDQASSQDSPEGLKKEHKSFASGLSDHINRWVSKTGQPGSSHSPTDLRHVDIVNKRRLFESQGEVVSPKPAPNGKIYK